MSSKIVCLGGGNAMPKAVLRGLKDKAELTAVCAMLDSGGSSGRLRSDYGIRAPGDLRRALIALANTSPAMERLFDYRFQAGELGGHNFANLFITALELSSSDYLEAVNELKRLLHVKHEVLPVTLDKSEIFARLEDGTVIRGETNIDDPKHERSLKIEEVFLIPQAKAYPPVLDAIKEADMVVVGPGDLYSTLAQIMLVKGVSGSMRDSKAKIVYISNLMRKAGETNSFSVKDFACQIEEWLDRRLDMVLYHESDIDHSTIEEYLKDHPELLGMVSIDNDLDERFVGVDLIYDNGLIEHDPNKVSKALLSI